MEGTEAGALPEESWLRIFSFLFPQNTVQVSLTCKWWNTLWQDKTLWKQFHDTLLGGKPRPPLLPKAWIKSTKETIIQFHSLRTPEEKLYFAVTQGRTVLVDQLLSQHPELFYLPHSHPLLTIARGTEENLEMLTLVWRHFISHQQTSSTEQLQEIINDQFRNSHRVAKSPEVIRRDVIYSCLKILFKNGRTSFMRYFLSVSPQFASWLIENMEGLFESHTDVYKNASPEFMALLEEYGAIFDSNTLCQFLPNDPVTRWLMEKVQWQGSEPVLRACFSKLGWDQVIEKSLQKVLLQEADKSGLPFKWQEYLASYLENRTVALKVVKWLVKRAGDMPPLDKTHCGAIFRTDDIDLIRFMVQRGLVDVNQDIWHSSSLGSTPLIWAVKQKNSRLVRALLELGADPKVKGKNDPYTARSIANQLNLTDIRDLLLSADKLKKAGESRKQNEKRKRENGEKPEEKTREKKKQKTQPKKIGEAQLAEKKMEEAIVEKLKWLCDHGNKAVKEVEAAKKAEFSVFSLKMACRKYKLKPGSQKRVSLLQAVIEYLEDQEARIQ